MRKLNENGATHWVFSPLGISIGYLLYALASPLLQSSQLNVLRYTTFDWLILGAISLAEGCF